MDRQYAAAMRGIKSSGRMVDFIIELIHGIAPKHRSFIYTNLRFFHERENRKWRLERESFPVAQLGDTTIKRVIEAVPARREQERWLTGDDERMVWVTDSYRRDRSIYALIWEEAEHRGILSESQQLWKIVCEDPLGKMALEVYDHKGQCNTRGGHENMIVDQSIVCMNCRKREEIEEIVNLARSKLRGRLREFTC